MVKWMKVLLILALIFLVLSELPDLSTAYKLWVREILDKDFYQVNDVEELGKIYHSKTFYIPGDSLVEYYWDDNYILVGNYNISHANQEKYLRSLLQKQKNIETTILTRSVQYNINEDTLLFAISIDSNEDIIISRIIRNNYKKIVYIYGSDYSLDEASMLGIVFLYDGAPEYRPELLSASESLGLFSLKVER